MKQVQKIMGMDVVIDIVDLNISQEVFDKAFSYLKTVDKKFSTYKPESEISQINRNKIIKEHFSSEMREVLRLSEETRLETNNFFNIKNKVNEYDPLGLVKGWSIHNAAKILRENGCKNFLIDIGSDIQVDGKNETGENWVIGIKNPFKPDKEIIKIVYLANRGIATSGKYAKGDHIYNPNDFLDTLDEIESVTVIAENIYEADRFATAIFAMGKDGINFLENKKGLEGYVIDKNGIATITSGFEKYTKQHD